MFSQDSEAEHEHTGTSQKGDHMSRDVSGDKEGLKKKKKVAELIK